MSDSTPFSQLLPGFDFLQGLVKNAGDAMPSMSQWIAPTLDPDEIDKRIRDLRTVQFWLEQNTKMIAATVQALEVQRMTLSTLRTMNLPLADVGDSMRLRVPEPPAAPAPSAPPPEPASKPARAKVSKTGETAAPASAGVVDPLQWWGALTQQFTELAAKAIQDVPAAAAAVAAVAPTQASGKAAGKATKGGAAKADAPKRKRRH
ncbi:MAG: hypothetical protein OEU93_08685 [Rubrivivax sp.]|nr:hypothetical protein [Rubrivivax sp.]